MIKKDNSTILFSVDQILKLFLDKKGHITVDEDCNPDLIEYSVLENYNI